MFLFVRWSKKRTEHFILSGWARYKPLSFLSVSVSFSCVCVLSVFVHTPLNEKKITVKLKQRNEEHSIFFKKIQVCMCSRVHPRVFMCACLCAGICMLCMCTCVCTCVCEDQRTALSVNPPLPPSLRHSTFATRRHISPPSSPTVFERFSCFCLPFLQRTIGMTDQG